MVCDQWVILYRTPTPKIESRRRRARGLLGRGRGRAAPASVLPLAKFSGKISFGAYAEKPAALRWATDRIGRAALVAAARRLRASWKTSSDAAPFKSRGCIAHFYQMMKRWLLLAAARHRAAEDLAFVREGCRISIHGARAILRDGARECDVERRSDHGRRTARAVYFLAEATCCS